MNLTTFPKPTPALGAALSLALALALSGCHAKGKGAHGADAGKGERKSAPAQMPVDVYTVATQPFAETVSATGALEADEQITLRSEISGVVEEILFDEAQAVKKGQPLVRLRDEDQRATLTRALAQQEYTESNAKRLKMLFEQKAISQADYDEAAAQAKIAVAEAEVARVALEKTHIDAPFDGVIGLRNISVGTYLQPTAAIAEFRKVDSLKLDFSVPERYLPFLKEGLGVKFNVAGRASDFDATVYAIEPGVDIRTRTVRLRARAAQPPKPLLPGTYAQIRLELSKDPEALMIPSLAILPALKEETVYVLEEGKAQPRPITTRLRTGNSVLVAEGIKPGEKLIVSNLLQLRPGLSVIPRREISFRAQSGFAPVPTSTKENPAPAKSGEG
jgi:membrane fusion protein (multidrug efflux system)